MNHYKTGADLYNAFIAEIMENEDMVSLPKMNMIIDYYSFCLYSF